MKKLTRSDTPYLRKGAKLKKIVFTAAVMAAASSLMCINAFALDSTTAENFLDDAIQVLQAVIGAIGAALAVYGVVNLLEGYSSENSAAKSQGIKQLMGGLGIIVVAIFLVPKLSDMVDFNM